MPLPSLACVLCSREDRIGEEGERGGLSCKDWKSQTSGAEFCHFLHGLDEVINLWRAWSRLTLLDAPHCASVLSLHAQFTWVYRCSERPAGILRGVCDSRNV